MKHNPKNNQDFWMFKAPLKLKEELDRVRIERLKQGKDKQIQSYKRLGLAMARHQKLLNDLIIADMRREHNE
jgi:hypothetical protein